MGSYPIILEMAGRSAVVVGGGRIAEDKVEKLLPAEAKIRVVSPQLTPRIKELADEGRVEWVGRDYLDGDLEGAFIAIAATDSHDTNGRVFAEAEARGIPINAVDDVEHCTFIAPAVFRNGSLIVAITTEGKAPTLAVRIRDRMRELYGGEEFAKLLELAGSLRDEVAATGRAFEVRAEAWYRLIDSDVLELLRQGRDEDAVRRARECLSLP
ncbi:MAG: bifunctional precorrin-2 dehydrogenase/sirohydrochlorin ferrochelatase [Actinomycetota bacterium]